MTTTGEIEAALRAHDKADRERRLEREIQLGKEQNKPDVVRVATKQLVESRGSVSSGGKTYSQASVQNVGGQEVVLAVRTVSKEEQSAAAAQPQPNATEAQAAARYRMRPKDQSSVSFQEYKKMHGIETEKPSNPDFNTEVLRELKKPPELQNLRRATGRKWEYSEQPSAAPPEQGVIISNVQDYDPGYEARVKQLMQREKNLEQFKERIYNKLGIQKQGDEKVIFLDPSPQSIKNLGKAAARAGIEIAALPAWIGGRISFIADTARSKKGREYLWAERKAVPTALKQMYDPGTAEGWVNIGLTAAAVQAQAAKGPPGPLRKLSNRFVEFQDTGLTLRPSVTQEFTPSEILQMQGQKVTGVHASFSDLFKTFKNTAEVKRQPGEAKGFRQAIEEYGLYKSLPEKGTGKPQIYGGYIGIIDEITGPSKVKVSFGEPKRRIFIFRDEIIEPVSAAEKAAIKKGGVAGGREIVEFQRQNPGKAYIAPENLLEVSTEGQYINPEGSQVFKVQGKRFTEYQKPATSKNPIIKKVQEVFNKRYWLELIDVETVKGPKIAPRPILENVTLPRKAPLPVKSISVGSQPFSSIPAVPKPAAAPRSPGSRRSSSRSFTAVPSSVPSLPKSPNLDSFPSIPVSSPPQRSIPKSPITSPWSPSKGSPGSRPPRSPSPGSDSFSSFGSIFSAPRSPGRSPAAKPKRSERPINTTWGWEDPFSDKNNKKKAKGSAKGRYNPTLKALLFGEVGRKPKHRLTGIEPRPIPQRRK